MTINSLNIIVPLKNEENNIKNLVENLTPVFKKIDLTNFILWNLEAKSIFC